MHAGDGARVVLALGQRVSCSRSPLQQHRLRSPVLFREMKLVLSMSEECLYAYLAGFRSPRTSITASRHPQLSLQLCLTWHQFCKLQLRRIF